MHIIRIRENLPNFHVGGSSMSIRCIGKKARTTDALRLTRRMLAERKSGGITKREKKWYDNKPLTTNRSQQKMMLGEVTSLSRDFCVFYKI